MFTKKHYNKWLKDKSNKRLNKKMVKEFPFLLPRNRWTNRIDMYYDYSYNELWAMPDGWAIAFGYELLRELKNALIEADYLDKYRIVQIKEKWGSLRWYDFGAPEKVYDILRKYEELSYEICIYCGEPATHETCGWINYVCEKCFYEHELYGHLIGEDEEDES